MLDPQGTESRLRAAGFQVARAARNATVVHEVTCAVERKTVAVQQCLSLSEFVAAPAQSRSVQLVERWRQCKTYACTGGACSDAVSAGLRDLEGLFLANFHTQTGAIVGITESTPAAPTAKSPGGRLAGGSPGVSLYYLCYILTCITVLFRWEFRKHSSR
jgi:hypothetical protein